MILKTVTIENHFAVEFQKIAKDIIFQSGSPFIEDDMKNFLKLSLGSSIEKAFKIFNIAYFSFPHYERVGMYDKFDDYSEKMIDALIDELQKLIPTNDKKLKQIYSLTCSKMLSMIIEDLELLGDEELIELIKLENNKVIKWSI